MAEPRDAVHLENRAGCGPTRRGKGIFRWPARAFKWALAIYLCVAFFGLAGGAARAQISPGPLAKAHRSLDGSANCTKCHEVSTKSPTFRCVECHREIADELQRNTGLHATFPRSGPAGSACVKCHSDHNGENF